MALRAQGRRLRFSDVAPQVQAWVRRDLGAVEVVREHRGGMSPGCATTLRAASGAHVFVKAVGTDLNEQTVSLFRHELTVLASLSDAPYRPGLLGSFDDGQWVGIALDAIDGRPPDLDDDADLDAVAATVMAQASELTPPPPGVAVDPLAISVAKWTARWDVIVEAPDEFLPRWAVASLNDLDARVRRLATEVDATTLCHADIRDDNLLVTPTSGVIIDWGMARLGPSWLDPAMLAWQRTGPAEADALLHRLVEAEHQEAVTDLLIAFGASQAWNARQPPLPNLPTMSAYCADDAARLLGLAALRLHANP